MAKINFHIITLFPEAFQSYLATSVLKRAQEKKLISINLINPRDFAPDKHKIVDDSPYGGGPGMVLKIEPIYKTVESLTKKLKNNHRIILFSTRGKKFNQKETKQLAQYKNLILICGRYEGVDERVAKYLADEEISIGDYVLSGGELPALVLTEAVSRHIPGVLGKYESLEELKGSYPVYTRPEVFNPRVKGQLRRSKGSGFRSKASERSKVWRVPDVLLSGNHKKISDWRTQHKNKT